MLQKHDSLLVRPVTQYLYTVKDRRERVAVKKKRLLEEIKVWFFAYSPSSYDVEYLCLRFGPEPGVSSTFRDSWLMVQVYTSLNIQKIETGLYTARSTHKERETRASRNRLERKKKAKSSWTQLKHTRKNGSIAGERKNIYFFNPRALLQQTLIFFNGAGYTTF